MHLRVDRFHLNYFFNSTPTSRIEICAPTPHFLYAKHLPQKQNREMWIAKIILKYFNIF